MGIFSRSDLPRPLAIPDTPPPDLGSPSYSSHSSRPSEDWSGKATRPISPPMSSYDHSSKPEMSAGKGSEESRTPRVDSQGAPRLQLPSLSSIFGPVNQMRPVHSPVSDRPSPLYSPLDRPHSASTNPERSYSNSYFPPVPMPAAQPRSMYEPRLDSERARTPLPSSRPQYPGPTSPRTREFEQTHGGPRQESALSGRWPSHSSHADPRRSEYVFSSRDSASSFRPVNDRFSFAELAHKTSHESVSGPREHGQMHPGQPSLSPTSTAGGTCEGMPVKDGLGPKIWTGTHFLPRFVRQAEVQGEGLCYFYDDGSHCKTVIDGEQVNAHWGVTKAGKPRKRLAIACLTCREKKIKCDPDFPRCVQCEKFGRVCKFKNAPRGGHNTSPITSPGEHDEPRQLGMHPRQLEHARPRSTSSTSISPRTTSLSHPSPELPGMPLKRVRVGYEQHYESSPREPSRMFQASEAKNYSWQQRDLPRIHEDILCRTWQTDPYVSDPQATTIIITSFFNHIETTALRFLPAQIIKDWVKNNAHTKSPEDLTLLYSLLAFGVHVSGGPKHIAHEYAQVARFACERSNPGMRLVQSRLVLSTFYLACSREFDSYEMLNAAISGGLSLQYNLELDQATSPVPTSFPYQMNRTTYAESRRRTFFSCFILERTNGIFPSRPTLLNADDIFLRLPYDETLFNKGVENAPETPMFDIVRGQSSLRQGVGIMGYLLYIVEIWGWVLAKIHRETRGSDTSDSDPQLLDKITERLRQYQEALPPKYGFSESNLAKACEDGIESCLVTLHLLLILAQIQFSRHVQSGISISPRPETAAHKSLSLAGDLMFVLGIVHSRFVARCTTSSPYLPTPMAMYAAVEAVDIMTAGGSLSSIPNSIKETIIAKELCEALSPVWQSARDHKALLDQRTEKLMLLRDREANAIADPIPGVQVYRSPNTPESSNLMYRIIEPLETRFPLTNDVVYGLLPAIQATQVTAAV
ncbi:uncharacterized protein BCR38DRAFT_331693 [Pseudomassariella vexata]|uniref:Zn(2)-C6 fungal-type domain-containing protein n=1 Tax=Pseudomassariella vexata TaxID=1141098 RepID=A0A1Y2EJ77_9PEZI|nr:uncharacterized protein BCR38DRAFT_331693 [Pseudomassariella vexata]ORY71619.1 hypothetical protein BCR38DRAFT_331693 [Pseudomassariella vexata]